MFLGPRFSIVAVLVLGALAACPTPPKTCFAGRGGVGGGAGTGGGFGTGSTGLTGQPMNVQLQFPVANNCDGTSMNGTSVVVSVLDPSNQLVTASASMPSGLNGLATTTVTFTPPTPGPYHLTARLEPDLGTAQTDVLVALDKTNEAPVIVGVPVSPRTPNCEQIDFDGDTLLCRDFDPGTSTHSLLSIRAAQIVDSVAADSFAFSNGRVWTHSDADHSLHVYALASGGLLTPLGSLSISLDGPPQILPQSDRALVIDANGFVEVQYAAAAGITASPSFAFDPTSFSNGSGGQWVPDLGVVAIPEGDLVCSYASNGSGFVDAGCTSAVTVVGFDDDGVWWVDPTNDSNSVVLKVTSWRSGQSAPLTSSISLSTEFEVSSSSGQSTPQASPMVVAGSTDLYLPRFDGSSVFLVRYPIAGVVIHADSRRLWVQNNDTITWYPR